MYKRGMSNLVIGIIITLVVIGVFFGLSSLENEESSGGGIFIKPNNSDLSDEGIVLVEDPINPEESEEPTTYTIEMSSSGFSPSVLNINSGDTVTFVTTDSGNYWPASANHPTHRVYPNSDIKKCGSSEESSTFDSCEKVDNTYSFIFNEVGTWNYHNHLSPSRTGKIIVS